VPDDQPRKQARRPAAAGRVPEQLSAILERMSDTFVAFDRDWRYTYLNAGAERMVGRRREELLGKIVWDEFPQSRETASFAIYQRAMTEQTPKEFETYSALLRLWLHVRVYPSPEGLALFMQDVTARKRAEAELRASRDQLAALFRSVTDGILVQDATGRFVYANDDAARLGGFPSAEALLAARPAEIMEHFRVLDECGEPYPPERLPGRRVLQHEEVGEITLGFREGASGEVRWCLVRSTPLFDERGRGELVVSVLHDVTERRQAEAERERLLEAEQAARIAAQEALAVRDRFLSIASHELRTPLTALRAHIQLNQRQLARGATLEEVQEGLARALSQTDRLNTLVAQLLDVSRLTAGRLIAEPERVDVVALVGRVVEGERVLEPPRTIRYTAPDGEVRIEADPVRLEQVLVNLLSNARKYSPPETEIAVDIRAADEHVAIAVRDKGIGIPPEDQAQVFVPFHRAGNVDRGVAGLGLGLAIVHELVVAHGGTLSLDSTPGKGSTFTVTLPLRAAEGQ
jgi:PAS domain S-box-containing protein